MWKRAMIRLIMGVTVALAIFVMANVGQAEEIRILSGFIPVNDAAKPFKQNFERTTGITLSFAELESSQLVRDLKQGTLDAVANNQPIEVLLEGFRKYGDKADGNLLRSAIIAQIPLAVVVAKTNPVTKLSKSQLKGIFNGKITSWHEVGGPKSPIYPIIQWGGNSRSFFSDQIMDGEAYVPAMYDADPTGAVPASNKSDIITVIQAIRVDDSVKVVATPEITMTYSIITMGEPSPKVRKLIDFSRGAGKKYLKVDR